MIIDDYIKLSSFMTRFEAEMALNMLKSFDIDAYLLCDDCGGVRPGVGLVTGIYIMVNKEDYQKAKELLQQSDG